MSRNYANNPGYLLKIVESSLRKGLDQSLRSLGLTTPQYAVLAALEREPDLTNADLAKKCFVTPQTMVRLVQGLEQKKWVFKAEDPKHGLKLRYSINPEAHQILLKAHQRVNQIEKKMVMGLSRQSIENLSEILMTCASNLRDAVEK